MKRRLLHCLLITHRNIVKFRRIPFQGQELIGRENQLKSLKTRITHTQLKLKSNVGRPPILEDHWFGLLKLALQLEINAKLGGNLSGWDSRIIAKILIRGNLATNVFLSCANYMHVWNGRYIGIMRHRHNASNGRDGRIFGVTREKERPQTLFMQTKIDAALVL